MQTAIHLNTVEASHTVHHATKREKARVQETATEDAREARLFGVYALGVKIRV